MSKSIVPRIHSNFKYPELNNSSSSTSSINNKIKDVNTYLHNYLDTLTPKGIILFPPDEDKFIVKQFGTVNDMNIAPVIDRVINSLNCGNKFDFDNCKSVNILNNDVAGGGPKKKSSSSSLSSSSSSSSAPKKPKSDCQETNKFNIDNNLDGTYPYKFQIVSGVLDSSLQGGENMPEYFAPEIDIFMTIFDNDGNLKGAILRMTFLREILKNTVNIKNNANVLSHFTYIGFNEINGDYTLNDSNIYHTELQKLMDYVIENTFLLRPPTTNFCVFEVKLKDNNFRKWYYYLSDSEGPSVSKGINDFIVKIFNNSIGIVKDESTNLSETIIRVAQKIYIDCPELNTIFQNRPILILGMNINRSYEFESIFLLRIKYIGDKSRCTDSLFLNKNKYAECLQITGDENAYFTALLNGASTIYSPPSRFALYFAPYFTYGNVGEDGVGDKGKFLLNFPSYKEDLLLGESPTEFKLASTKKSKSESTTILKSDFFRAGLDNPLMDDLLFLCKTIINNFLDYRAQNGYNTYIDNYMKYNVFLALPGSTDKKQQEEAGIMITKINDYRNELEVTFSEFYKMVNMISRTIMPSINNLSVKVAYTNKDITGNRIININIAEYYTNVNNKLKNILESDGSTEIDITIDLSNVDFATIRTYMIDFFEKAKEAMNNMVNEGKSYNLNNVKVVPEESLTHDNIEEIRKNMIIFDSYIGKIDNATDKTDFKELCSSILKELSGVLNKMNSILNDNDKSKIKNIISIINFIFSIDDISIYILPAINSCKNKFLREVDNWITQEHIIKELETTICDTNLSTRTVKNRQCNKNYSNLFDTKPKFINKIKFELSSSSASVPSLSSSSVISSPASAPASAPAPAKKGKKSSSTSAPAPAPASAPASYVSSLPPASLGGAKTKEEEDLEDSESYRRNQIYILKCFSKIIQSNNDEFQNLLTSDNSNINYTEINSIDKYCLSLLMLQIYKSFNSYTPKLDSIEKILSDISILDEDNSKLSDAIDIRNYYSQIIDTFMIIEYLQVDAVDYVMALNENYTYNTNDTAIYKLSDNLQINYNMLLFIIDNLLLLNSQENQMLTDIMLSNFYIITTLFDMIQSIDVNLMSEFYELSKNTKDDSSTEHVSIVNNYEYICIFLIKYINQLFLMITDNKLTYSDKGLIYNYEDLLQKLSVEGLESLVNEFNSIEIDMINSKDKVLSLLDIQQTNNLNANLNNIKDFLSNLISRQPDQQSSRSSDQPSFRSYDKSKLPGFAHGLSRGRPSSNLPTFIQSRKQQGGTYKNKNMKMHKKTKKHNKNNIKNKTNKIEKKTHRKNTKKIN